MQHTPPTYAPAPMPVDEVERHRDLLRYQLLDTANEEKFDNITQLVADVFGAKIVLISLIDHYRQWFKSKVGLDACELDRETSFCGHAIMQRDVFYIENTLDDVRFAGNPLVRGYPNIRTYAGAPIYTAEGHAIGTLCIIFDQVTPQSIQDLEMLKRFAQIVQNLAETRLDSLILKAEREQHRELIAIVKHELRTPLVSLQMMQHEQNLAVVEPLGLAMVETTDHLSVVMDDLSTILEPTAKRTKLRHDSVVSVIERTANSLTYLLKRSGITLHLNTVQDAQQICHFDTQALRQLITNLIRNAAIHSGGSTLWVNIETCDISQDQYGCVIEVLDDGRGVPVEHEERLFDAGFRSNTRAEGSGLGLYICVDLANRLNGSIIYFRPESGGAGFRVRLNLDRLSEGKRKQPLNSEQQMTQSKALNGLRILVAEDDRTLQMLNETILTRQGAIVVTADNGAVALGHSKLGNFDLILTDIQMPELNGYELAKAVREQGYTGRLIGLSAHGEGAEKQQLLASGADAVIFKPLTVNKLIDCL